MKSMSWAIASSVLGVILASGCAPSEQPATPIHIAKETLCEAGCQVYTDDPNPDSVGVWMGPFTAASCYGGDWDDNDGDGIGDQCEWALAKRFAPIMINDSAESDDVAGDPYWAAGPDGDSSLVIAYLPAYYADLGCYTAAPACTFGDAHNGDSEAIGIRIVWHSGSEHWVVTNAALSAHHGYNSFSGSPYATGLEYPAELGGPFKVHVSWGKHANYATRSTCNSGFPYTNEDYCSNGNSYGDTLYVETDRNLGSAGTYLKNCVYSTILFDDYQECFWTGSYFAGWNGPNGSHSSAYVDRLSYFGFIF
jgi:hypothetical protein